MSNVIDFSLWKKAREVKKAQKLMAKGIYFKKTPFTHADLKREWAYREVAKKVLDSLNFKLIPFKLKSKES